MRKRFLAMLLSVAMVLTMLPVAAFAAEGDPAGLKITYDSNTKMITAVKNSAGEDIDTSSGAQVYYKLADSVPTEVPEATTVTTPTYTEWNSNTALGSSTEKYVSVCVVTEDENNAKTLTHWGVQALDPVEEEAEDTGNPITAKLMADNSLAVTFADATSELTDVVYASQTEAFITPAKSDSAYTNGWKNAATGLTGVKVGDYVAAAVFDSDSANEFTYWSTAQVEAGYITVTVADDAKNIVTLTGDTEGKVDTEANGDLKINVTVKGNYDLVVKKTVNGNEETVEVTPPTAQETKYTIANTELDGVAELTLSAKAKNVVVVTTIDATLSSVKAGSDNVAEGGAVTPTGDDAKTVTLTVTTTTDATIPTVKDGTDTVIATATVVPTANEKEWTVTVPYTGTGIMNIKLATSETIPNAEGLTVTAKTKDGDETKLTLTITDDGTDVTAANIANYVIQTVTDTSTPSVALGADVSSYTAAALEIDAKTEEVAITKVLVVKKNSGNRAIKAGVATVGAEETENVELTLTLTRDPKGTVKVAAVEKANPDTVVTGFKAAISSDTKLDASNLDAQKASITADYPAAGLTTGVAGKSNVNVIKEDGGKLYWGTAEIPVWVEATIDENSGITLKDGSSLGFAYAADKKTIVVTTEDDVEPAVLTADGKVDGTYTFTSTGTNEYTLTLSDPAADLTLKIGAKPAGTTETKQVTLTWEDGITVTNNATPAVEQESGIKINVPESGNVVYNVSAGDKEVTTTPETLPEGIKLEGNATDGYTLTIASTVTESTTVALSVKSGEETGDKTISAVAVTLETDGLKVGDPLPEAETTTTGVKLTTVWKDSTDKVVTTVEAADTTYTATITVSTDTGYTLAETVAYTLNEEDATATNNVITTSVTVTDDTSSGGSNEATGTTEVDEATGTVTGTIGEAAVTEAIEAATKDPTKDDVVLDFTATDGSTEITAAEVTIPAESVKDVNAGELKLTVKTPIATVALGTEAVKEIADAAPETDKKVSIVLTVEEPATNPVPEDTDEKEAQAFEIKFEKIVANADGSNPSAPTPVEVRKPVTLTLKTTVVPAAGSTTLIAYFVDGDTQTIVNANAPYDTATKSAKFTVEHLSTYMLKATLAEDETLTAADGTPINFVDGKLEVTAGEDVKVPAGVTLVTTTGLTYKDGKFALADGVDSGTAKFTVGGVEYTYVITAAPTATDDDVQQDALASGAFKKLYIADLTPGEVVLFVINKHSKFPDYPMFLTTVANRTGEASVIVNNGETIGVAYVYSATEDVFTPGTMSLNPNHNARYDFSLSDAQE